MAFLQATAQQVPSIDILAEEPRGGVALLLNFNFRNNRKRVAWILADARR
jgi:hypothetical protein